MLKVKDIITPFNRGFSAISVKYQLDDLTKRYLNNIKDKITMKVSKDKNKYYIYLKIPSESNEKYINFNIFYDVIIELIPPNSSWLEATSIRDYDIKVFANIPSFVFTFNFVYMKKRGLMDLPYGYYSEKAMKDKPNTRNPLLLLGIEKSLWFSIFYLDEHKFFNRSRIDELVDDNIDLNKMLKNIKTQDQKYSEVERRLHLNKQIDKNKKDKEKNRLTKNQKIEASNIDKKRQFRTDRAIDSSLKTNNLVTNKSLSSDLSANLRTNTLRTSLKSDSLKSALSKSFKK